MTVGDVEAQILRVEGFRVHFVGPDGLNRRSDFAPDGLKAYPFDRAANQTWTIAEWERNRFAKHYPGFNVVYETAARLRVIHRQTLLRTLRADR